MKPFTHWAIHHQQKIRIAGRDRSAVWGALAGPDGVVQPFRYDHATLQLSIGDGDDQRTIQLDEYGFAQPVVNTDPPAAT